MKLITLTTARNNETRAPKPFHERTFKTTRHNARDLFCQNVQQHGDILRGLHERIDRRKAGATGAAGTAAVGAFGPVLFEKAKRKKE